MHIQSKTKKMIRELSYYSLIFTQKCYIQYKIFKCDLLATALHPLFENCVAKTSFCAKNILFEINIQISCSELSFQLNLLRLMTWSNLHHSTTKPEFPTPSCSLPYWEIGFISYEDFELSHNNKEKVS